ncbi:MAG TPA: SGNH/GDSL hydrolase family protein [Egibacteraceae bacterium]|jgi:lysophospholipase L1-like esterase|nr:SGNH/GDSL hydrolase family protein [Egibacteraceae bacterium]
MTARRVALVAVGLPLAAVALLGAQVVYASRVDRPDLHPTYEVATGVDVPGSGPPLRLVVLGDSTAAGVGSPTIEGSLPALIAERVAGALHRSVDVVGHGVSGARTADILDEQVPLLTDTPADVLVISVGSNDVTHVTPPWTLARRTTELLTAAREAVPGTPVVLAGIPLFEGTPRLPVPLRWIVIAYARPLRNAQRTAALEVPGVRYADIARDASPRFRGVPDAMSADGYHPSPVGYGFWADAIAAEVTAAVGAVRRS